MLFLDLDTKSNKTKVMSRGNHLSRSRLGEDSHAPRLAGEGGLET